MPISNAQHDSRVSPPVLRARLAQGEDGTLRLLAPAVGLYRAAPAPGTFVGPDQALGVLEILGVTHHLLAPAGARGLVVGGARGPARRPVAFDDLLLTLDPQAAHADRTTAATPDAPGIHDGAGVFRAPTSGRLYLRPGPGKPNFVTAGAVITHGQTLALIEVMKTFSRVHYGGEGMPARARIRAILAADESDVAIGDPLLELEAVAENTDRPLV